MAQRIQVPIVLLTGFLGSGKTTLLAHWLRSPAFDGAMVIVNELGEVGLDHDLLTTASDAPLLLENGCACCAASDDLLATLERLFWDRLHRKIPKFSWVLIETTGVADPGPILEMLSDHQLVRERYRIAGVVSTFDAVSGAKRLKDFSECRQQLAHAGVVIITKSDLVEASGMDAARDTINRVAPAATVLTARRGDLEGQQLLDALGQSASAVVAEPVCGDGHQGCDGNHEAGDHHHHDHLAGVTTAFLAVDGPLAWGEVGDVLATFAAVHGECLLRLKGSIYLDQPDTLFGVQVMAMVGVTRTPLPVAPGREAVRTGFTIIAQGIDAKDLATDLNARLTAQAAVPLSAAVN